MDSTLVIVEKLNSMYSSAFTQIQWMVGIIVAFLGIVVPVFFYLLQQRLVKIERKEIEVAIAEKFDSFKNELKLEYERIIIEKFESQEMIHEKKIMSLAGGIFMVQGNTFLDSQDYEASIKSFIQGALECINSEDWVNLRGFIVSINNTLALCNSKIITNEIEVKFNKLMEHISAESKVNDYIKLEMKELKPEFEKAKERK